MSAKVELDGMAELKAALQNMPAQMQGKAMAIVRETTEGAARDLKVAYPQRNYGSADKRGNLKKGVRTEYPSSAIAVGVVKSTAPHSHLYEFGTQNRRTLNGANRGAAPAHPTAVPIYQRRRKAMNQELVEMVKGEGFEITGSI